MSIVVYQSPYTILNKTLLDKVKSRGERLDRQLISLFISSIERGENIKDKYNSRLINYLCGSDYVYIYNLDGEPPLGSGDHEENWNVYIYNLDGETPLGSGVHKESWVDMIGDIIGHHIIESVRFDYGGMYSETYRLCDCCGSRMGLPNQSGVVWCGLC
jgi:hypothetical protein